MSHENHRASCLDPETLAAFAEGKLMRAEIAPVLAHLRHCPDCTADVAALRPRSSRRPALPLLAAAAAIAIVFSGALLLRNRIVRDRDPIRRLVSLAPRDARIVEPRVSGGFAWSPWSGPMRESGTAPDAGRLKLAGAAGEILDRVERDRSPDSQRAAGIALLLVDRPLDAVARLRAAAEASPNDARLRNDLAAAEYAAAARMRTDSLYPAALADVDAALRIDARFPEALFNRALILERLGLSQAAREAWQRYLVVDPSSPWAKEARERLARHPETTTDRQFRSEQPRLERLAAAGDDAAVAELVGRYRQQSRAFGEGEYLGHWGEALLKRESAEASRQLTVARALGGALARLSGERLLQDAVRAIDAATPERQRALAEAHVAYRRGRIAYSRQALADAETDLRRAARLFARGGSPMALPARYYAASTRYDQRDVAAARAELESLLREAAALPGYRALAAHIRWELVLCLTNDNDWSAAASLAREAASAFCELGETSNCGFLEMLHANVLVTLGRPDEAWTTRIRSFEMLSASGRGDRLQVSLGDTVAVELRSGHLEVARSLAQVERGARRDGGNDVLAANALARQAILEARAGDDAAAAATARESALVAARIREPGPRRRALTDADFAGGVAALRADARRAAGLLDRAIDGYRAIEAPLFLAECHLLRARARMQNGEREAARRDLDDGIAAYERHPIELAEGVVGTGVFDAGTALYQDALALALDRGDTAAAFAYAERSLAQRGASAEAVDLAEIQRRLRGSAAMLLELAVLPEETVVFSISAGHAVAHRRTIASAELIALAGAAARGEASASSALYELLIRPAASHLAAARQLIVVPGPRLEHVPFPALADSTTHRTLIEQLPLSFTLSASTLRPAARVAPPRAMVALELASDAVALPESVEELAGVRRLYAHSTALAANDTTLPRFFAAARNADVIHLAGHSSGDPSVVDAELLIGPPGNRERMSWRTLAPANLGHAPVVVLAACNTLRAPQAPWMRGLSLGGAFVAAGAGDVIGTLAPIPDRDARVFFEEVHRRLAAGMSAAEAVRQTQLELIGDPRRTVWKSVAVLTTRIPTT